MRLWKRKPASALGAHAPVECARLSVPALEDETARSADVARFPGHSEELADALAAKADTEIAAAAALPIDPEVARTDALALERLDHLREVYVRAGQRETTAHTRLADLLTRDLPDPPAGVFDWLAAIAFFGGVATLAAFTVGTLIAPSIDVYLLRSYARGVLDADAEAYSAQAAFYLGVGIAAALLLSQLLVVFFSRGRVHGAIKAGFLLADLAFAGGFAVMRLGGEFTWQAVAPSLFEFAISLSFTLLVIGFAGPLRRDAEKVEPWRRARRAIKAAERVLRDAVRWTEDAETRFLDQARAIATREDGARREGRLRTLARATVEATYAVAASRLVDEAATNEPREALVRRIEARTDKEFERERRSAPS